VGRVFDHPKRKTEKKDFNYQCSKQGNLKKNREADIRTVIGEGLARAPAKPGKVQGCKTRSNQKMPEKSQTDRKRNTRPTCWRRQGKKRRRERT